MYVLFEPIVTFNFDKAQCQQKRVYLQLFQNIYRIQHIQFTHQNLAVLSFLLFNTILKLVSFIPNNVEMASRQAFPPLCCQRPIQGLLLVRLKIKGVLVALAGNTSDAMETVNNSYKKGNRILEVELDDSSRSSILYHMK